MYVLWFFEDYATGKISYDEFIEKTTNKMHEEIINEIQKQKKMKSCKNCEYFQPCSKLKRIDPFHVRGFCMDFENETFNSFAKAFGRGLDWKAYFNGTEGCRFKKR